MGKTNRTKLLCKDCRIEIFSNKNMIMIKDKLWKQICDDDRDAYCDNCIEKRLKRPITQKDFKPWRDGQMKIIPCNYFWILNRANIK